MITLDPEQAGFLDRARVAHLATASADGMPHVVPVCFVFDGTCLFTAVDAKPKRVPGRDLRRLRNLRENPRVSLVVDQYEEDWTLLRYLLIRGRGDILEAGSGWHQGWDLLRQKYRQYQAIQVPDRGPVIRIIPERIIAWQAGRGWTR